MEFSMSGCFFMCLFLSCFSISSGEAVNESELHKLKRQDVRHRQDIDPGYIANRPDSPYKISKRSTSNTVDIAMFTDSSASGKQFSVYVDSTMTRLIVEVKVDRSNPVIILSKPSGLPVPRPKLNGTASAGTVTAIADAVITAADYGIWKLTRLDANTWNVKIQGESPLDFSYQFLKGNLIKLPVTGDPIQDETYTTVITVPEYATIQKVDMILEFVTEKFTPANMFPPSDQGGGKYQVASIKMLDKDFMIGIQGHDKSGHFFRRITVIKPIAMILYVPSFAGVKLYENTKLDIPFSVVNKLSTAQDIDVGIKDTQGFAEAPKLISATSLKPGQNYTGKFVIKGGLLGVTTSVTITAKPYLGRGKVSHGPSEVRQFTVENNQTTTTSTSTTTLSTVTSTSTVSVTSKPTTPSSTASSSTGSSSISTTKPTATATISNFPPSASSQVTSNTLPVILSSSAISAAAVASSLSNSPFGSKTTAAGKPSKTRSTISPVTRSTQCTVAVSSNQPIGSSRSGATSVVATSLQASAFSGGKVSTTHASASTKSVSAASGASSDATTMIKSTSGTNGKVSTGPLHVKSTIPPVTQHAAVSALSSSSGQTTATSSDVDKDEHFSKGEVFGAAVVSGVSAGVLIGVAALVTMGLVFKHSINKRKVTPDKKKQRMLSEHDQVAWT